MSEQHEREMHGAVHRMEVKLARIEEQVVTLTKNTERKVNLERFTPIEKITYGIVALILAAIVGAGMKGLIDDGGKVPRSITTQKRR